MTLSGLLIVQLVSSSGTPAAMLSIEKAVTLGAAIVRRATSGDRQLDLNRILSEALSRRGWHEYVAIIDESVVFTTGQLVDLLALCKGRNFPVAGRVYNDGAKVENDVAETDLLFFCMPMNRLTELGLALPRFRYGGFKVREFIYRPPTVKGKVTQFVTAGHLFCRLLRDVELAEIYPARVVSRTVAYETKCLYSDTPSELNYPDRLFPDSASGDQGSSPDSSGRSEAPGGVGDGLR